MSPQNIDIDLDLDINSLVFDGRGLIPAIIQDAASGQVLMMAWMNKESLAISIEEGKTCFYSRSRKTLWRKGETSGNTQDIISITADCDKDTLLVKVRPAGPACHTGEVSCFFNGISKSEEETEEFSLDSLYSLLRNRKANPAEGSYTSYLFDKGEDKILKKVGEESTEVIIAAKNDRAELRYEIADLAYHLLVLMAAKDLTPAEIREELASRHIVDKKTKQEKMG